MPQRDALRADRVVVRYPRTARPAIQEISFEVAAGSTLAIVGPSGAGKTTLLRALAGLLRIDSGDVLLGPRSVRLRSPQERRIALVFAEDALLPHCSIERNLQFVARDTDGVSDMLDALELGSLRSRSPRTLSSGERRRVSLARALLARPTALLLDEPLAALDPELRGVVREELLHVRERFDGPMVLVTHDHADAMTFAQQLAVLIDGRFEDVGDPERVYDRPASVRTASFLGARPMNIMPGAAFGEPRRLIGIRPERLSVNESGALRGTVTRLERTGADVYASVATQAGPVVVRIDGRRRIDAGEPLAIAIDASDVRRFDERTGLALA